MYHVKEIIYTIQGEGAQTGMPAVFCRFTGCNLWSGLEADRSSAICQFCDTDFVGTDGQGGGRFDTAAALATAIDSTWTGGLENKLVVCTGGEPLLQMDTALIDALHATGMRVALETNGTLPPPPEVDWVCVSPKSGTELTCLSGNELKVIYPQTDQDPNTFTTLSFDHFYIQPMDGPNAEANHAAAIRYCLENPRWKLSIQTHKRLGLR